VVLRRVIRYLGRCGTELHLVSMKALVYAAVFMSTCSVSTVHADHAALGLSAFAIQAPQYQGILCSRMLRAVNHSQRPALAALYHTFGQENTCLKKFWRLSGKRNIPHLTEIHFSNEVGRRNDKHDDLDFLPQFSVSQYNRLLEEMPPSLENTIRMRVREIVALIEPYKNTGTFILSTGLEDNYSVTAWLNIYRIISAEWPYEIARSTLPRYIVRQIESMPQEIYIEYHGYRSKFSFPQRCITNGDGQDVDFLEGTGVEFEHARPASLGLIRRWLKNAAEKDCITFIWTGKWQGIHHGGKLSQPLSRNFRFDASDVGMIRKLFIRAFDKEV
jgi:hypothetical protein